MDLFTWVEVTDDMIPEDYKKVFCSAYGKTYWQTKSLVESQMGTLYFKKTIEGDKLLSYYLSMGDYAIDTSFRWDNDEKYFIRIVDNAGEYEGTICIQKGIFKSIEISKNF